MTEEANTDIEEREVAGHELQKFVSKLVMEPKVKRVTLLDKAGGVLLDIPTDSPAYKARAMRTPTPSLVNTLGIIGTKEPEVRVRIQRD